MFDLPHVIDSIPEGNDISINRISFISGNVFESVPKSDSYILKNLLHIFNDDDCVQILQNIQQVAESKAKILIIESLIGEKNQSSFGKLFDIQLMVGTDGERTKEE